jgi:hypothetical protein
MVQIASDWIEKDDLIAKIYEYDIDVGLKV